jgi:hypothetical protein
MKRTIATLTATLAVLIGGLTLAGPAHAEDCNTVPELPGECLDQATYAYILGLQRERDFAVQDAASVRESLSLANVSADYWHTTSDHNAAELVLTRQSLSIALSDVQSAYEQIDRLNLKVTAQRATIKRLRDRLRDLP